MGQRVQIVRQIEVIDINGTSIKNTEVLHSHWGGYSNRHFLDIATACANAVSETSKFGTIEDVKSDYLNSFIKNAKEVFAFTKCPFYIDKSNIIGDEHIYTDLFKNINNLKSANKVANKCNCDDGVIAVKIILVLGYGYDKVSVRIKQLDLKLAFFEATYKNDKMITKKVSAKDLFHKWNLEYLQERIMNCTDDTERKKLIEQADGAHKEFKFFEAGIALLGASEWDEFRE